MKREELIYYVGILLLVGLNIYFYMDADWAWKQVEADASRAIEPMADGRIPMDIAKASFGYLAIGTLVLFSGIAMFAQRTRVARFIYGIALFLIFVFFDIHVWAIYVLNFIAIAVLFLYSYKTSFIDSVRKR